MSQLQADRGVEGLASPRGVTVQLTVAGARCISTSPLTECAVILTIVPSPDSEPDRSARLISELRSPDIDRASTETPRPAGTPTITSPLTVAARMLPDQARRTVTSPEVDFTDAPLRASVTVTSPLIDVMSA